MVIELLNYGYWIIELLKLYMYTLAMLLLPIITVLENIKWHLLFDDPVPFVSDEIKG